MVHFQPEWMASFTRIYIFKELNAQDLDLVIQIINILAERKPLEGLYLAEPELEYLTDKKKRKDLIYKIETTLGSSPKDLSTQEDWLRETLQIALKALKGSPE